MRHVSYRRTQIRESIREHAKNDSSVTAPDSSCSSEPHRDNNNSNYIELSKVAEYGAQRMGIALQKRKVQFVTAVSNEHRPHRHPHHRKNNAAAANNANNLMAMPALIAGNNHMPMSASSTPSQAALSSMPHQPHPQLR